MAVGRDLPEPQNGAPGPFALADPDHVRRLLTGAGYTEVELEAVDAPIFLGTDSADAWVFCRGMGIFRGLTDGLDDADRQQAIANLQQLLADKDTPEGVLLEGASWIITARR
jgi:hypothetical protein